MICRGIRGIAHLAHVEGVPAPGAFSRATKHCGFVFVSGTGAGADDTGSGRGEATSSSAYEQTRGALENVATILRRAGSSPRDIVNVSMLLTDKADYAECNRAYVQFFEEHGVTRALLPSRSSAMWAVPTDAKVAFSCIAVETTKNKGTSAKVADI